MAVVLALTIPTPVGGNISRFGELLAVPLACWLLVRCPAGNRRLAAAAMVGAIAWTGIPLTADLVQGGSDPSREAGYYSGLLAFLSAQNPVAGRLEIPMTREHWETSFVAPAFPLARGWERQTDLADNAVLYRPLTAAAYEQWLDSEGVALVALSDASTDFGGLAEARLLAHPPSYLTLVYSDRHWRVWRVAGQHPLVTGAAVATQLGPASFQTYFTRAGAAMVRLRASGMWQVSSGAACLSSTPDGWLQLTAAGPGFVTVRARINSHLLTGPGDCDLPTP
jgi:hypothetical protein